MQQSILAIKHKENNITYATDEQMLQLSKLSSLTQLTSK